MFIKSVFVSLVSFWFPFLAFAIPTPTERYFEEVVSLDELRDHCIKSHFYELDDHLQFYFDVMQYEHLKGFFGYHGCSQQYRIFQDILRAVFEEALEIPVPADFQFLRIPGDPQFNFPKGVTSFYEKFDRKRPNKEMLTFFVSEVILGKINAQFNTNISIEELISADTYALWFLCEDMFALIDMHSMEDLFGYLNELYPGDIESDEGNGDCEVNDELRMMGHEIAIPKKKRKIHDKFLKLLNAIYVVSSQIPFELESMGSSQALQSKIVTMLRPYLIDRSNQDIIAYLDKELNPQALLFQLLRVLHGQQPPEIIWNYVFPYNDVREEQRSLVVALNISLFGNYFRWDESTLSIHGNNRSVEGGEEMVYSFLEKYFHKIGLNPKIIIPLVRIAEEELNRAQIESGCILQFFDKSAREYEELKQMAYTSHSFGIPIKTTSLRDILLGNYPLRLKSMDYQARILTSNLYTINPYGHLGVLRHELTDPHIAQRIITRMRELIRGAPIDVYNRDVYKAELQGLWK